MALISSATTPITLTLDQQKAIVAKEVKGICNLLFTQNVTGFVRCYNTIWSNSNGLTPQEVCDALGTDAGNLFTLAGSLQAVVNAAQPGALPQAPLKAVTINSDGTVTLAV